MPGNDSYSCNQQKETYFIILSLTESFIVLGLYTFTMLHVLYNAGKSLDLSAYITISVFFISELASLIFYCINAFTDEGVMFGIVPGIIMQHTLYAVLLFYAYQMQVVKVKLQSEDHLVYQKNLKIARMKWATFTTILIISLAFEIGEKLSVDNKSILTIIARIP